MSKKSNHVIRPSGLRQSADGKYIYANCVITGKPTFFKQDYFTLVLSRDFGGDENKMAKGYVCKEVKKLRKAGKKDAEIKTMLGSFDAKAVAAAKKEAKKHPEQIKADKLVKVKKVKRTKVVVTTEVVAKATEAAPAVTRTVYPWTDNPGYFRSESPGVVNFQEATKDTCFYPATHLDHQCEGCPIYDRCTCELKVAVEDRAKAARRSVKPIIKALPLLDGCFDKPEGKE